MKLLHRHIFANVAATSLAAVGVLTFIMVLGNVLKDLLGSVLAGQLSPDTFVHLVVLTIPFVVSYALPMGVLTGVLLMLGRMSADREITAIRAAGTSVAGISAPIFAFALLGTVASLFVNFFYMPRAKVAYEVELAAAVRQNPLNFIVPRTFIREFPGKVIYVGEMKGSALKDIWVWDLDRQKRVRATFHARAGELTYDESGRSLNIVAHEVYAEGRGEGDPENYLENRPPGITSEKYAQVIPLGAYFGAPTVKTKLKWLTLDQLLAEWRRLGQPDAKVPPAERARQRIKLQTVIQEKAATAFSVLSFALLAIPLGIKVSRKETSANLGVALALAMGYYFATVVVGWFDNKPDLRPDLLMWVPNLGFQVLGVWMFYKVDRQ